MIGEPLQWSDSKPFVAFVREHGIQQFIHTYNRLKGRRGDCLKWGEEVEYMIIKKNAATRQVFLSLRADTILHQLMEEEHNLGDKALASWRPEYANYMLEGTPFKPYGGSLNSLLRVEQNMRERRALVQAYLEPDELLLTFTTFPLMGAEDFTWPHYKPFGKIARSLFLPDEIINPHPRFGTLTGNIRERRGGKVCILVPLYLDSNTDPRRGCLCQKPECICGNEILTSPSIEMLNEHNQLFGTVNNNTVNNTVDNNNNINKDGTTSDAAWSPLFADIDLAMSVKSPTQYFMPEHLPIGKYQTKYSDHSRPAIYMDAMGFGMGCCCLQCTFQASDITEARELYDQLAIVCPIMLAVSAATPILRGLLADTDVRWNVVSASVDDRTPAEKTPGMPGHLPKSRYDSISVFIAEKPDAAKYSDLPLPFDTHTFSTLIEAGIDKQLARHVAHLFVRDPLVIFKDRIQLDDQNDSDHWENIQSTNWQTVRFKPPPPNSSIGWRVEFRVMEVQLSDWENAAYIVFIVLLTRTIISFGLNFYMPISKVDENMAKAHKRDAVLNEKFTFRKNVTPQQKQQDSSSEELVELTINEVINGSDQFVGLIPLVRQYLDNMNPEIQIRLQLEKYLELISRRASGRLMTAAKFLRETVLKHPNYNHDSVVTREIAFDLVEIADQISKGTLVPPELLIA